MTHRVIYHLLDEVGGMLLSRAPQRLVEEVKGVAEVLQVFDVKAKRNVATVAGCLVSTGRFAPFRPIDLLACPSRVPGMCVCVCGCP